MIKLLKYDVFVIKKIIPLPLSVVLVTSNTWLKDFLLLLIGLKLILKLVWQPRLLFDSIKLEHDHLFYV